MSAGSAGVDAEVPRRVDRPDEAGLAYARAVELAPTDADRTFLGTRAATLG